jgi:hypothetical protein
MVSPAETLSPFEDARPDEERPPVKVEVPAPVAFTMPPVRIRLPADEVMPLAEEIPPAMEESPPVKVEVAAPFTSMRFSTVRAVVLAFGKMFRSVVEVETNVDAVALPSMRASPFTPSLAPGVVVPMPRLPFVSRRKVGVALPPV